MEEKTRLGLAILCVALLVGIIGDSLLRATPLGLNLVLWVGLLSLVGFAIARWQGVKLLGGGRWAVLPAIFFAGTIAWHDSVTLGTVNFVALLAALTILASRARCGRVQIAGISRYVGDSLFVAIFSAFGALLLLAGDVRWGQVPRGGMAGNAAAVSRGLFIAIPLVLIFGGLFMAADAVFEDMIRNVFDWSIPDLIGHIIVSLTFAWVVAGFLRLMLIGPDWKAPGGTGPRFMSLGIIEMGTILGALDALFLAFVMVQSRYLFGGTAFINATNISYSDYARRGFFELVTVAVLVLPVLLFADWAMRKENPGHVRIFRTLATALVLLLFVVIASAVQRMYLYYAEYGLTELRLYTMVFMGWIAFVFCWFIATVQRGQRERFAFGMVVTGFLALAALNLISPEAIIVKENVGRARAEQPMDARNVAKLSADAVPTLIDELSSIAPSDRRPIIENLLRKWSEEDGDWRTWNWSRSRAVRSVKANRDYLWELQSSKD
ncbi:MAG: DUF4173 domain-containing protein [Chloroflexi bacterium]|nr:DUF4173 domain-containing protein [Chloroflexota bacterium]